MFELLAPSWLHHFIASYGLWVLFVILVFESIGVPLPGESALIATALYAGSTHQFSILAVVLVAALASIIGDNIGYLIGRTIGLRLAERYGHFVKLTPSRLQIGQYLFLKHGGKIVFFGRFVAFFRTFASLLAGANRMPWGHFLIMNILGGLCWAGFFGFGAYALGQQVHRVAGPVGLLLIGVTIAVVIAGGVFLSRHEKTLERRAIAALGPLKA